MVLIESPAPEFGTRGFVDAYDADTGKQVWRFWTVAGKASQEAESPGAAIPGSVAACSTWITGTYDPELNLVYWGTGNPDRT
jgi:alcohol dehydrogenase (cytochrome c)